MAGDAPAVAYAGRVLGQTCLFQGRFAEAREHLREALRVYSPGWDASVRRQLGSDAGIGAKAFLAMVAWHVGDAAGAAGQLEAALTEALASEHVPTIANNFLFKAMHEMARGDAEATLAGANVVLDVAEKTACGFTRARLTCSCLGRRPDSRRRRSGAIPRSRRDSRQSGRSALRAVVPRPARGTRSRADVRGSGADFDRSSDQIGGRGRHPTPRRLGAPHPRRHLGEGRSRERRPRRRSLPRRHLRRARAGRAHFGLQAALALAKHYQSTGRAVEAHDVLTPALEGFSPTPEFPQIAEAKALFEALAHL